MRHWRGRPIAASQSWSSGPAEAAQLLKLLANETRLLILCRLVAEREMSVGDIVAGGGLEPVGAVAASRQAARRQAWSRRAARRRRCSTGSPTRTSRASSRC